MEKFIRKNKVELVIFLFAFLFSWWLMFSSFSYDKGFMQISSKSWSDFASHIPLIRSFSFGNNFPPQYPLFSGPLIKYHFLFYAAVGFLEKVGFRIDYALNILSILGFSFLILMIYLFSKEVFKSKTVGILSILFFLFNGSLGFLQFFSKNGISDNLISSIINSDKFASFGPYDGSVISAFWNLNIYTNQRHLAISYALSLFIIYIFLRLNENKKENIKISFFMGIILGISFLLNMAVFLMTIIVLFSLFIFLDKKRFHILISLLISGLISLPIYLLMQSENFSSSITFHAGYLLTNPTLINFFNYWLQNLGLHLFLIPLGLIYANKINKKIFISFLIIFAVGNLIQFSPEIAANHKFFNYFMIFGVMYSSYFIIYLWNNKNYLKPFVVIIIFFLILSGIIDFFPIFNDKKILLADYPVNKDISWIIKNTKHNSVFLNTNYLYDNASLAGRKIFLGWPYFAWSQGYDTNSRDNLRKKLLKTNSLAFLCTNSHKYGIDYIETESYNANDPNQVKISNLIESNLKKTFENNSTSYKIYSINQNCKDNLNDK